MPGSPSKKKHIRDSDTHSARKIIANGSSPKMSSTDNNNNNSVNFDDELRKLAIDLAVILKNYLEVNKYSEISEVTAACKTLFEIITKNRPKNYIIPAFYFDFNKQFIPYLKGEAKVRIQSTYDSIFLTTQNLPIDQDIEIENVYSNDLFRSLTTFQLDVAVLINKTVENVCGNQGCNNKCNTCQEHCSKLRNEIAVEITNVQSIAKEVRRKQLELSEKSFYEISPIDRNNSPSKNLVVNAGAPIQNVPNIIGTAITNLQEYKVPSYERLRDELNKLANTFDEMKEKSKKTDKALLVENDISNVETTLEAMINVIKDPNKEEPQKLASIEVYRNAVAEAPSFQQSIGKKALKALACVGIAAVGVIGGAIIGSVIEGAIFAVMSAPLFGTLGFVGAIGGAIKGAGLGLALAGTVTGALGLGSISLGIASFSFFGSNAANAATAARAAANKVAKAAEKVAKEKPPTETPITAP